MGRWMGAAMSSFEKVFKFIFLPTAALLVVFGLVLCAFGIYGVIKYNSATNEAFNSDQESRDDLSFQVPAAIIAAFGLIILLILIVGCIGGFQEKRLLLAIYIPLIIVVFIIFSSCVIAIFIMDSPKARENLKAEMDKYDPNSSLEESERATALWDEVQKSLKCCGVDSYQDWSKNVYLKSQEWSVPESCCHGDPMNGNKDRCTKTPEDYADDFVACKDAFNPFKIFAVISLISALLILVNMVASCFLCAKVD